MVKTRGGSDTSGEEESLYSKLREDLQKVEKKYPPQKVKRQQKKSQILNEDEECNDDDGEIDSQEEDEEKVIVTETEEDTPNKGYLNGYYIFLAVVVILVAIVGAYPQSRDYLHRYWNSQSDGRNKIWLTARLNMNEKLKPKYAPHVPPIGFRVVENALKDVLNRNDSIANNLRVPSVILLVGTKKDKNNVQCFASDIIKLIANAYENTEGSVFEASQLNAQQILESFDTNFNNGRRRSIFLNGIEGLKGRDPTILHRYTDHDNSIFRDVVILLSAYGDDSEVNINVNASTRDMDRIANSILEKAWISSMDENGISALLSRITPSVVVLMNNLGRNTVDCS